MHLSNVEYIKTEKSEFLIFHINCGNFPKSKVDEWIKENEPTYKAFSDKVKVENYIIICERG